MTNVLELLKDHPIRHYEAGEVVLKQGAESGVLLVLINGTFEVRKEDFVIDQISEPGSVFGEIALLAGVGHSADVIATEPSWAHVIEGPHSFMRDNPAFHLHVSELLARRLNYMVAYLSNVKHQYEGHDHLGMVDEVLETLVHKQLRSLSPQPRGTVRDDAGE